MAYNNLRIIYNNLVDLSTTTLTASSGTTTNLKSDIKSKVWRSSATTASSTTVKAFLLVQFAVPTKIGGICLAFTNLNSSTATINLIAYSTAPILGGTVDAPTYSAGTSPLYSTATQNCCPWNQLGLSNWGTNPQGASVYAYGGGTYARFWNSSTDANIAVTYLLIEITDNYATSGAGRYIEASRLIVGPYWSPVFNTGWGMESGLKDTSSHERTESGDLVTKIGPRFSTLSFDLSWLTATDRVEMTKILKGNGIAKPLFVSLFPNNGTTAEEAEQERAHQIYGKLSELSILTANPLNMYSTRVDLEEV